VRQARPAFEAAALQHMLAGFAGHALHEAMLMGAVALFWLVGLLRHKILGFRN